MTTQTKASEIEALKNDFSELSDMEIDLAEILSLEEKLKNEAK